MNQDQLVTSEKPDVIQKRGRRTNSPGLKNYEKMVSQHIRRAIAKDNPSLKELSRRLCSVGIEMDNKNLSRKIQKGKFSASLYLAIRHVLSEDFNKK